MIQIDDKIVSFDIFEKKFLCNINACKGACCVEGDSGAPIEPEEILDIEEALPSIFCHLSEQSIKTIEKNGVATIDADGDLVTVLNNNKECVFVNFENGIAKCAIEKSFENGKCEIPKPVSCHLYPIRLKKHSTFTAVNYEKWNICKHSIENGKNNGVPIYKFAKNALIRKFGNKWYDELCVAANYVLNEKYVK